MDLSAYLKKCVKVDTSNGFYFIGIVLSADSDSLTMRDKRGRLVTISLRDILNVKEVQE